MKDEIRKATFKGFLLGLFLGAFALLIILMTEFQYGGWCS